MKCSECGKNIEENTSKCPNCGNIIKKNNYDDYIDNYHVNGEKDLKKMIIIGGIIVVVSIVVIIIVFMLFSATPVKTINK